MDRQHDEVRLAGVNFVKRTTRWELRPNLASAITVPAQVEVDFWPVSLQRKDLDPEIKFFANGVEAALVTRRENARMARNHLVWHAISRGHSSWPTEDMWDYLGACVGRFPQNVGHLEPEVRARRHVSELVCPTDRIWLREAIRLPGWAQLLANYEDNHILAPRVPPKISDVTYVFELRTTEQRLTGGPQALRGEVATAYPGERSIALRLPRAGHARSHSIRLYSPEGTFLHNPRIERIYGDLAENQQPKSRSEPFYVYRTSGSRAVWTLYMRRRAFPHPRSATILATLWPRPNGFVVPMVGMLVYAALVLSVALVGQVMTIWPDLALGLRFLVFENFDGAIALGAFVPGILIGWVFATSSSSLQRELTAPWRVRACVVLLMVGSVFALGLVATDHNFWKIVALMYTLMALATTLRIFSKFSVYTFSLWQAHDETLDLEISRPTRARPFVLRTNEVQ